MQNSIKLGFAMLFFLLLFTFSCEKENSSQQETNIQERLLPEGKTTMDIFEERKFGHNINQQEEENSAQSRAAAKPGGGMTGGCDCELKINSIDGDWSVFSITQDFQCDFPSIVPVFGYDNDFCVDDANTPVGVWLPFNCDHPHFPDVSHNTIRYSSLYNNGDDCQTFINTIIGGDMCAAGYFAPTTASITIRCEDPNSFPIVEYHERTFELSSNDGDPATVCASLGTTGTDTFLLSSDCAFRR